MINIPEIKQIKYIQSDGAEKTANIIPVEFSANGLDQEELAVLDALSNAVNSITPIYAQQQDARTLEMLKALKDLEVRIDDPGQKAKLEDFITLFTMRNAPYDLFGLGVKFPIDMSQIPTHHPVRSYPELLSGDFEVPAGRNLYPPDITKDEFKELGDDRLIENSSVIRLNDGSLKVVLNEERFSNELSKVIAFLERARSVSTNPDLKAYITAKICELRTGTQESRKESDLAWLKNSGSINFVLGTGIETYLDQFKGVRGAAMGTVFTVDKEYESISSKLLKLLPQWEAQAPWKHKKEVDLSNLPKLNYVNVFTWTGFYDLFPMVVVAESLPNDKEFVDKYGSVNMLFVNIHKARFARIIAYTSKEFFLDDEMTKYFSYIPDVHVLLSSVHELGHTTGSSKIKEPGKHFGEEYSRLEEARCELFSLWALPSLVRAGVISPEQEIAGYYSMLENILRAMEFEPRDHNGARNMMFHYFMENGAIIEKEEEGRVKYAINPEEMKSAVETMLATLGNIRAEGDFKGLERFKEKYISTAQQEHFKRRLEKVPLGAGFIFPTLEHDGERYTRRLIYPATFREQLRTLEHFV